MPNKTQSKSNIELTKLLKEEILKADKQVDNMNALKQLLKESLSDLNETIVEEASETELL
jgi:hypothetical protein